MRGRNDHGFGRRFTERRFEEVGHRVEHRLVLRDRSASGWQNLAISRWVIAVSGPIIREPAVRERGERRRGAREHLEAVCREVQVADDLRAEEAVDVRGRRDAEAGEGLLGVASAAEEVAAFEDRSRKPARAR